MLGPQWGLSEVLICQWCKAKPLILSSSKPSGLSLCPSVGDICLVLLLPSLMISEAHGLSLKPTQVSSGANYPTSVILSALVFLGSWRGLMGEFTPAHVIQC